VEVFFGVDECVGGGDLVVEGDIGCEYWVF